MRNSVFSKRWVAVLAAIFCNLLWGSAPPFIKIGYQLFQVAGDDPSTQILFAGFRFFLAGVMTILFASLTTRTVLVPKRLKTSGKIIILALFQTILQYFFYYIGLAHTTGSKASILCTFNIFFSILLSTLLFHMEKLRFSKIIGCILGLFGVVLVNLDGLGSVSFVWNGEGFILVTAMCGAISSVLIKRFSNGENPVLLSGWQFAFGGLVMMAVGKMAGGHLAAPTLSAVLDLIYLAFLSAAAYGLWAVLLKNHPVSKITVFGFVNPLCGVLLSTLLLQENAGSMRYLIPISLVLVCLGVYLVNRDGKKPQQT